MNIEKNKFNDVGSDGTSIYPMIEHTSIINCNAYVLSTPEALFVIDPGGTTDRGEKLSVIVEEELARKPRPAALLVTHCHWDHVHAYAGFSDELKKKLCIILPPDTSDILSASGDKYTLSDIYGDPIPAIKPDLLLFTDNAAENSTPFTVRHDGLWDAIYVNDVLQISVRQAPGHARDGIFIKRDNIVFVGDIFFALTPGVVGTTGWDAMKFRHSATILRDMAKSGELIYCQGHDKIYTSTEAAQQLDETIEKALQFKDAVTVNRQACENLEGFSVNLLEEAERIFTKISERLKLLGLVLDKVGEKDVSKNILALAEFKEVESILTRYRRSLSGKRSGEPPLILALLGLRTVSKLGDVLKQAGLTEYIDPVLIQRIRRLINDFANCASGVPFNAGMVKVKFGEQLKEAVDSFKKPTEISEVPTNDHDEFVHFMMKKMASRNILNKYAISVVNDCEDFECELCWDHFFDAVLNILETLAETKCGAITLQVIRRGLVIKPENGIDEAVAEQLRNGISSIFFRLINCRAASSSSEIIVILPD